MLYILLEKIGFFWKAMEKNVKNKSKNGVLVER